MLRTKWVLWCDRSAANLLLLARYLYTHTCIHIRIQICKTEKSSLFITLLQILCLIIRAATSSAMAQAFFPLAAIFTHLIRTVCHPPWPCSAAMRQWSRFSWRTVRRMRTPSRRLWQSRYGYLWLYSFLCFNNFTGPQYEAYMCTLKLLYLTYIPYIHTYIHTYQSFTYPIQGLDTIKTKGESIAMVLALVGAGKSIYSC